MAANPQVRVEITATDRATAAIKGVSNQISKISSSLMKLGAAYATVRVGFAAFEALTTKVAAYGEEILIASQKTGMTTEQISALRFAAGQDKIEFEALTKSLGIFSRNLVDLGGKGNDTQKVLKGMGLASRDAGGQILPMHELLLSVADRFSTMEDGAEKAAAAQALFGKSGAALIPFLNQGASGIKELEKKAESLGITLSEDAARAADAFGDQMQILGEAVHGGAIKIGMEMMPTLTAWAVRLGNIGLRMKQVYYGLQSLAFGFITVAKASTFQFGAARDFWTLAEEAADKSLIAQDEYNDAVSAGNLELQRALGTRKALGDTPDLTAPKEDKDAKRRLEEIKKAFQEVQEAAKRYNDQLASVAESLRDSWDPTIQAAARMEELNQAWTRGLISGEELSRGIQGILAELAAVDPELVRQKKAFEETDEATKRYSESLDSAGKALKESLQTPAEKATVKLRELTQLLGTGRISAEEFSRGVRKIQSELEGASSMGRQFGEEMASGLTQMIVYGRGGIAILQGLVEMIVAAILKALIFKAIWKELGGEEGEEGEKAGGIIGFLVDLFGGLAGIGRKQAGGPAERGRPYVVGEAGPEVFIPKVAGEILPHHRIPALGQKLSRLLAGNLPALEVGGPAFPGMPYLVGERGWEVFMPAVSGAIVSHRNIGGDTFITNIDARGADPSVEGRLRRVLREVHRSAIKRAAFQVRENALRSGR